MKRTYKLKQWYPTIPKHWEVGTEVTMTDQSYPYYFNNNGEAGRAINKEYVEECEDFWTPVLTPQEMYFCENLKQKRINNE